MKKKKTKERPIYIGTPHQFIGGFEEDKDIEGILEEFCLEDYLWGCKRDKLDFDVCLIPPFGNFKKYELDVVLFPFSFSYTDNNGIDKIGYISNPLLYAETLCNPSELFETGEMLNRERLLEELKPTMVVRVAFSELKMASDPFRDMKKRFNKVREFLVNKDIVESKQGKNQKPKKGKEEFERFVIEEYKRAGMPERYPKKPIQIKWDNFLNENYKNRSPDSMQFSDKTIERILDDFNKKRKKEDI